MGHLLCLIAYRDEAVRLPFRPNKSGVRLIGKFPTMQSSNDPPLDFQCGTQGEAAQITV